ncbi:MAG: hypothetical protein ABIL09_10085 [Gemmatimonadota bacterium]
MRTPASKRAVAAISAALAALLSIGAADPAQAELGDAVTVRRAVGLAFIGGSAALTVKGFDYRQQADDFYTAYKSAADPVEIERLYQRTTNRDVKAQVSWALAAAFGLSGLRLVLTGDVDMPEPGLTAGRKTGQAGDARAKAAPAGPPPVSLDAIADGRQMGLAITRRFF